MNDWNYTKKGAKVGLLYGLAGGIYFAALEIFVLNNPAYLWDIGVYHLGNLFLLTGVVLFSLLIIPLIPIIMIWPSFVPDYFLFSLPITGLVIGIFCSYLLNSKRKNRKDEEKPDKNDEGIFVRISLGREKFIAVKEKTINCCIIIGIVLWALLFFYNFSGVQDEVVVLGTFEKGCRPEYTINFDKDSGTFTERSPGITETGTYIINETSLTLYYSDGKAAEYTISNTGNELYPANRSQCSSEEEWRNNNYLKSLIM